MIKTEHYYVNRATFLTDPMYFYRRLPVSTKKEVFDIAVQCGYIDKRDDFYSIAALDDVLKGIPMLGILTMLDNSCWSSTDAYFTFDRELREFNTYRDDKELEAYLDKFDWEIKEMIKDNPHSKLLDIMWISD